MTGQDLLKREIIKFTFRQAVTKAMVVGFMAKSPGKLQQHPEWMLQPAFSGLELGEGSGQSWVDLDVSERKFHVRKAIEALLKSGQLRREDHTTVYGQKQVRLKVGTVLDRLASIDPEE